MKFIVKVAEHTLAMYTSSEKLQKWILTHFQVISTQYRLKMTVDLTIDISDQYGQPFDNYHVEITSDEKGFTYKRSDYLFKVSHDYRSAKLWVHNELALKHALTTLYSAFIVHIEWGLLIHSSCVAHQEKAYLFAGPSGAGKSTVSRLSYPRPILSDEASLVKIGTQKILIFDSPFRSELLTPYPHMSCQLAKILVLNQSIQNHSTLIQKSNAMITLLNQIFFWGHDPMESRKLLRMCRQLIEIVPTYQLDFQKNDAFWEMIS